MEHKYHYCQQPLDLCFTTAKSDATDQHSIKNHCTIKYTSEKKNAAADGLDNEKSVKQLCFQKSRQSIVVQTHNFSLVESLPIYSLDDLDTYPENIHKEAMYQLLQFRIGKSTSW